MQTLRLLIADDEPISRRMLERLVRNWNFDVETVGDGEAAWRAMQRPDRPSIAILDWMMPGMDGVTLCRRLRAELGDQPLYLILLTAREDRVDMITGLEAGADDYIVKPFNSEELRARLAAGRRIVELQRTLADRIRQLQEAMDQIKTLEGILPICCYCKKIRNDQNYWQQLESYIATHSAAQFTHGICPECYEKLGAEIAAHGPEPCGCHSGSR